MEIFYSVYFLYCPSNWWSLIDVLDVFNVIYLCRLRFNDYFLSTHTYFALKMPSFLYTLTKFIKRNTKRKSVQKAIQKSMLKSIRKTMPKSMRKLMLKTIRNYTMKVKRLNLFTIFKNKGVINAIFFFWNIYSDHKLLILVYLSLLCLLREQFYEPLTMGTPLYIYIHLYPTFLFLIRTFIRTQIQLLSSSYSILLYSCCCCCCVNSLMKLKTFRS